MQPFVVNERFRLKQPGEAARTRVQHGKRLALVCPPSHFVEKAIDTEAPKENLNLKHVYGFTHKVQNSLLWLNENEIMYVAASLCVVQNIVSGELRMFNKHDNDVTALAHSTESGLCASGQKDPLGVNKPRICVWSPHTDLIQYAQCELLFHSDYVAGLCFSPNGDFLFSVGGDSRCQMAVWRLPKWSAPAGRERFLPYSPIKLNQPILQLSTGTTVPRYLMPLQQVLSDSNSMCFFSVAENAVRFWNFSKPAGTILRPNSPTVGGPAPQLSQTTIVIGSRFPPNTKITSFACSIDGTGLIGDLNGSIYLVKATAAVDCVQLSKVGISAVGYLCDGLTMVAGDLQGNLFLGYRTIDNKLQFESIPFSEWLPDEHKDDPQTIKSISLPTALLEANNSANILRACRVSIATTRGIFLLYAEQRKLDSNGKETRWKIGVEKQIQCTFKNPSSIHCHPQYHLLAVVSDSSVCFLDAGHTKLLLPNKRLRGPEERGITQVRFSPNGDFIALACENAAARIVHFPSLLSFCAWRLPGGDYRNDARVVTWSPCSRLLAVSIAMDVIVLRLDSQAIQQFLETLKKDPSKLKNPQRDFIYNPQDPNPKVHIVHKLKGSTSPVNGLSFSADGQTLGGTCKDGTEVYWEVRSGGRVPGHSAVRDVKWMHPGFSLRYGWSTSGLWSDDRYADNSINSVSTDFSGKLVAISDDMGSVKIFKYPAYHPYAKSKVGVGHSAHVGDISWLVRGDGTQMLYSGGASDQCVMEWECRV